MEFGLAGDSGNVAYFYCGSTILMLTSCFLSAAIELKYPPFRLLIAVRWLVRRLRPFAKFSRTAHRLAFSLPCTNLSTGPSKFLPLGSHRRLAPPCWYPIYLPYTRTSTRTIPVTDPLLMSILLGWFRTFVRFKTLPSLKDVERKAANHLGC